MVDSLKDAEAISTLLNAARADFDRRNKLKLKQGKVPIPDSEIEALELIRAVQPLHVGVLDACDGWLTETRKETARAPSDHEWKQILESPLEGAIGVSLALQWRYNFGRLFGELVADEECTNGDDS
jgi:hypothetical protein